MTFKNLNIVLLQLFVMTLSLKLIKSASVKYYTTRFDHVDIDHILNNKRLVMYYAACLLDKGPCPPQGAEFKKILPEALESNCARCTEKQKFVTFRSIKRLKKEYPKIWSQLSAVWDPNDIYVSRFEAQFEENGLPVTTTVMPFEDRFGEIGTSTSYPYPPAPPLTTTLPPVTTTTRRVQTTSGYDQNKGVGDRLRRLNLADIAFDLKGFGLNAIQTGVQVADDILHSIGNIIRRPRSFRLPRLL